MKQKSVEKIIKIADIAPNQYNPNVMDQRKFQALRREIRNEGFLQRIVVRENNDPKIKAKYIIVDGENRWRAATAEGLTEVPAIIVEKDLDNAKISTINFNNLRGDFDAIKLAHVISDLNKTFTMDELEERLGIPTTELDGIAGLVTTDDLEELEDPGDGLELEKPDDKRIKFEIMLSDSDMKIIESAIRHTGATDPSNALKLICLEYLAINGQETN